MCTLATKLWSSSPTLAYTYIRKSILCISGIRGLSQHFFVWRKFAIPSALTASCLVPSFATASRMYSFAIENKLGWKYVTMLVSFHPCYGTLYITLYTMKPCSERRLLKYLAVDTETELLKVSNLWLLVIVSNPNASAMQVMKDARLSVVYKVLFYINISKEKSNIRISDDLEFLQAWLLQTTVHLNQLVTQIWLSHM